ncbi:DUF4304 domain-containing protein [Chryseobacterium oryctis]|uniref:DUF4304 domain-containing protein n=1 Tax=Chryseobacterium oryctis TaxID=2952618 RepID=A0ABT3HSU1_9FLAO|nr:DUF4304 domain-containing protein [Chryseobacterium oryctis]MCW3162843.1 DUF4304 domain-containing protein [Chryseobacterium oryctis]
MEKKELINIISNVLSPIGFKRKGNSWVFNDSSINKIVNLQKSQFGNYYYINYGYILNAIPLNDMMHIYNRVTSINIDEREEINLLLNLESNISDKEREDGLKKVLQKELVDKIQSINIEDDLLEELRNRPHLNDIPLVVKQYFQLPVV